MNQKLRSIIVLVLVIAMLLPVGVMAEETKDLTVFYVAKDGNNSNAGTEDAPFATIEGARDAIREAKKAGTLGKDGAVVYIREGEYYIENSIVFNSEDSGTKDAPVVYRNYPDENVSFVGAATIDWGNFKPLTDRATLERIVDTDARKNIVVADLFALGFTNLPELSMPGTYSYHPPMPEIHGKQEPIAGDPELVINGQGMTVARYPNDEYMEIADVIEPGATPRNWLDQHKGQSYWVAPEDRKPDPFTISLDDERVTYWSNAKEAMISGLFYYSWASQTVPMASVNPEKKSITSTIPSFYGILAGQSVYVYNLIEEIDIPGEYYVDRKTGKIYLYPPSNNIEFVAYTTLDDYMFKFAEAKYIKLKGIDMSYMRSGAVEMSVGTSNCEVVDSEINYPGKRAIVINGSDCKIYDSFIHDVEGGIDLNGGNRQDLTPGNNVAENNEFTRCDRMSKTYMSAVSANGAGNHIVYNKIHDADHTIVQFNGNDHTISFNEIFDAVQYTDDMGAIYTGRDLTGRGNVISHNYLHDIGGATIGGQGNLAIFLDDWFSAADIYGTGI
ncbi:MAG: right-handed parallel beta-helix repeat-containing protein [Clostridia bacterium]|nr:right-handed parallel beta-helix repeat-containing protein [Clostridia bacterium]